MVWLCRTKVHLNDCRLKFHSDHSKSIKPQKHLYFRGTRALRDAQLNQYHTLIKYPQGMSLAR